MPRNRTKPDADQLFNVAGCLVLGGRMESFPFVGLFHIPARLRFRYFGIVQRRDLSLCQAIAAGLRQPRFVEMNLLSCVTRAATRGCWRTHLRRNRY